MPQVTISPNKTYEFRLNDCNMVYAEVLHMSPRIGERIEKGVPDFTTLDAAVVFDTPETLWATIQSLHVIHNKWIASIRR